MNLSQIANALDGGLLGNASGSGAILAAADAARDRSDRAVTIKPNPEIFRRHSTSIAASCVNRLTREMADTQQRGEDWLVCVDLTRIEQPGLFAAAQVQAECK